MYKAIEILCDYFDEADVKYRVFEHDEQEEINVMYTLDSGASIGIEFIVTDNLNDVAVRVFDFVKCRNKIKESKLLEKVNEMNCKYRFFAFSLEDGDVSVRYDMPSHLSDNNLGEVAMECIIRLMRVLEDVYPEFMAVIWG